MKNESGERRQLARKAMVDSITRLLHQSAVKAAPDAQQQTFALKAESFQDEDGVIIAVLSKADVYDREDERALLPALKAATWRLAMKGGPKNGFNFNHGDAIKASMVGCYFDYDNNRTVVHIRPDDREIYEAAKCGDITGLSWEGPYKLKDAA